MNRDQFLSMSNSGVSAIVGPGLSLAPGFDLKLLHVLNDRFNINDSEYPSDIWSMISSIVEINNLSPAKVRFELKDFFRRQQVSPQLQNFSQIRFRSLISLTPDPHLGEALNDRFRNSPSARDLMRINSRGVSIKSGYIPLYQLMGDSEYTDGQAEVPVSKAEQMSRRRSWRAFLKDFKDISKSKPVICVGVEESFDLFLECINELVDLNPNLIRTLVLVTETSIAENSTLNSLLGGRPMQFDLTVLSDLAKNNAPIYTETLTSPPAKDISLRSFLLSQQLRINEFSVVPTTSEVNAGATGKHQALEQLFRPESLEWTPFAMDLDFPREQTGAVGETITLAIEQVQAGRVSTILLNGEAGVGKTTLMKRVGIDLADANFPVIWLSRPIGDPAVWSLKSVLDLYTNTNSHVSPLVVVVDVGLSGRRISSNIESVFAESKLKVVTVCILRKSDSLQGLTDQYAESDEYSIGDTLTSNEVDALPGYLQLVEIAVDESAAKAMIKDVGEVNARDILCLFWFLIPDTRKSISNSLVDEYFGLGRPSAIVGSFAEATNNMGGVARRAYEFAAVGSNLGVPIPAEVLINALEVDYSSWSDLAGQGTSLWGLIYASEWPSADTHVYQTRNEVVTRHLIRLINGNSPGNTGELNLLNKLIEVCDSTLPVYRDFLAELLVKKKVRLKNYYEYEEILSLYDLALAVLPSADRTIAHHRALCIRDIGRRPSEAYDALLEVRKLESSVITENDESVENIETSAAAAMVDAIERDEVATDIGAEKVKRHLENAISSNPYNLYTYHVSANHLLKIADRFKEYDPSESLVCVSEAARTIRRALSLVKVSGGYWQKNDSIEMLESLRARICAVEIQGSDVKAIALELLANQDIKNINFEAALRIMLLNAQITEKGKDYNEIYNLILRMNAFVDDPLTEIPINVNAIRVEILTDWKVQSSPTQEDWADVFRFSGLLAETAQHSANPMWRFWQGVSCFHLGDLNGASAIFHQLRAKQIPGPIKHAVRHVYLDHKGNERSFTGELKSGHGYSSNKYVVLHDFGTDLICKSGEFPGSSGSTVVVKIGFTFAGPLALRK